MEPASGRYYNDAWLRVAAPSAPSFAESTSWPAEYQTRKAAGSSTRTNWDLPITLHHIIPQAKLISTFNNWITRASQPANADFKKALLAAFTKYSSAGTKYFGGVATGADEADCKSELAQRMIWNVGNTAPGPTGACRSNDASRNTTVTPDLRFDYEILDSLGTKGNTGDIKSHLNTAWTVIQKAQPDPTDFFKEWIWLAANPVPEPTWVKGGKAVTSRTCRENWVIKK